jgi:CheY-like chemotaxis protein
MWTRLRMGKSPFLMLTDSRLEALNKFKTKRDYDFILLDLDMPIMDGYETCRKIKQRTGGEEIRLLVTNQPKPSN